MTWQPIKGTSKRKIAIFTVLFIFLMGAIIQLDLPTFDEVGDSIRTMIAERQIRLDAVDKENFLRQGWVYYNLGQYDKAEQVMLIAAAEDDNISAIYCLGLIDMQYQRYDSAISRLKTVADKSPRHEGTRVALGKAFFQLRYYGRASDELEKAIQIEPTNEEARLWLGKTYLKLNKTDFAISMLDTITHGREAVEATALVKSLR